MRLAKGENLVALLLIVVLLGIIALSNSAPVVFPYTVVLPHYNVTWRGSTSPTADISIILPNATKPSLLLSVNSATNWIEYQGPKGIYTYKTGNEFTKKIETETIVIQNVTSSSWNVVEILGPNVQGLSYTTILPNGANVLINYTINTESELNLPVPRSPNDQNCSADNRFEFNCTCDANHIVPAHSVKFTVQVTNWTFAPLEPNMTYSILGQNTLYIGDFNLDYYLTIPDSSTLLKFDVCDVGYSPLNMSGGAVITKMSYFSNFFADKVPTQISSTMGATGFDQATGLVVFPFTFLYPAFEEELLYDPDFSILLTGGNNNNGDGGAGGAPGTGNSNTNSNKNVTVAVAVVIPVVALIVLIIVVIGVVAAFILTKRRRDTMAKASSL
eukprot:TRINITY_DN1190_c0_g2_i1.p1 TRINITY_DN1190_c0_g2~~TRINITY_DN1190_c0_g2_i1.p1  ORF type:complete len:387 (+),score=70.12 TRINITY_DN1190_c0_g2_i1:110-1270(+)